MGRAIVVGGLPSSSTVRRRQTTIVCATPAPDLPSYFEDTALATRRWLRAEGVQRGIRAGLAEKTERRIRAPPASSNFPLPGRHQRQHHAIQLLVGKVAEADILVNRPMLDMLKRGAGPQML